MHRLLPACLASLAFLPCTVNAALVADSLPFPGNPDWTEVVFTSTTMVKNAAGTHTTLTTSPFRGLWFGNSSAPNLDSQSRPTWSLGNSAQGNLLSLEFSLSAGAADWSAYFGDGTYYAHAQMAPTACALATPVTNCYGSAGAEGVTFFGKDENLFVPLDITARNRLDILLKAGVADYAINGLSVFRTAAVERDFTGLTVGDGTGSTATGVGSMTVFSASFDNAPAIDGFPPPVPVPAALPLAASAIGLLGTLRRRRRR